MALIPLVLLLGLGVTGETQNAFAWDLGSLGIPGLGTNAYAAGQQDAQYDHSNGLAYNDEPSCLTCHSQLYNDNFQRGYDSQWNSYQNSEQTSDQHANVNVEGNDNIVNVGQSNVQSQDQQQNQGPSVQPVGCGFSCVHDFGPGPGPI